MERATHFSGRDIWSDFAKHNTFELRMEVLVDLWQVQRMPEHFNRVRTAGKTPGILSNDEGDEKESSPGWHWEMGRDEAEKIRCQDQFLLKCDFVDIINTGI